jgi:hypothetical protein
MPDQDYFTWHGRRVWLQTTASSTHRIGGTIVRVRYAPFSRDQIDVVVEIEGNGVTVIEAEARGKQWDFEPRRDPGSVPGADKPEAKSA